jgi:hypothetical protein
MPRKANSWPAGATPRWAKVVRTADRDGSGDAYLMHVHDETLEVSTVVEVGSWQDVEDVARLWSLPMEAVRCRRRTRQLLRAGDDTSTAYAS